MNFPDASDDVGADGKDLLTLPSVIERSKFQLKEVVDGKSDGVGG